MKLLEEGTLLKEERNQCRRLSRGIQGFGSFQQRSTTSTQTILREKSLPTTIGRCNSDSNNNEDQENKLSFSTLDNKKTMIYQDGDISNNQLIQKSESSSKENMEPWKEEWNMNGESESLLDCGEDDSSRLMRFKIEDDHPFNSTTEKHSTASLLSARDGILQGC
ncbi:epsin-3-like [Trifolium medium]|uniref:Epsin-3-like n=1 Tax=Trifolium medium TaxID=97028 RepID=A0A392NHG0_9FABA|nr:epsin-3-like [Trifolium medium]